MPGAVLLAGSLVAIVYPLLEGRQLGWPVWVWPVLGAGLAGLGTMGVVEQRRARRQAGERVAPLLRAGLHPHVRWRRVSTHDIFKRP